MVMDNSAQAKTSDFAEILKSNPGLMITSLYIYLSTIGILYEYFIYRAFKINIIDFIEVNDLIVAAFKDPGFFIVSLGVLGLGAASFIYLSRQPRMTGLSARGYSVQFLSLRYSYMLYSPLFTLAEPTLRRLEQGKK